MRGSTYETGMKVNGRVTVRTANRTPDRTRAHGRPLLLAWAIHSQSAVPARPKKTTRDTSNAVTVWTVFGLAPGSSAPGGGQNPSGSAGGDPAVNQGIAQSLAIANGHPSWVTGQEWTDWVQLWNDESGWNQDAVNPSSGAFGIAQALGHGTPGSAGTVVIGGTTHDEYGANFALTTSQAMAANNGNASGQILWGIGYIAARYGSPSAALAHENTFGFY